ncbi:MDIS1-interacting receptor like kinase 1-like, partial [Ananas comosus]|uniref:MDIS1-interacting receptor like kinase 1-like n=1 Tax=Ananas comosus TaxID=4615 RepID=A0A6P5EDJ6_ANACO
MNFTKLEVLKLSGISLHLEVDDKWIPPFQVNELVLSSCQLGPRFPRWLQLQEEIFMLDLSNNDIIGAIPNWFWDLPSPIVFLNLSNNQISGMLPSSLENMTSLYVLDLASNYLEGFVPFLPDSLIWLDLSSNMFSGSLQWSFFTPDLFTVLLSDNSISGNIPSSICNLQYLRILDMSDNKIFGELPNCWNGRSKLLTVINLSNNNLSGHLPDSLGLLGSLNFLHLNNNSLYGELPSALQNCPLVLLDLGQNKLSGEIPVWLGKLTNLTMLRLMSNIFASNIPAELGQLENLQILDLSWNNLSGSIPQSFGNFHAMASTKLPGYINQPLFILYVDFVRPTSIETSFTSDVFQSYTDQRLYIATKGSNLQFSKNLFFEKSIDLSSNNLHGAIPEELVDLSALNNLNLSRNHLTGRIPNKIGNLYYLESLDLSMNELNGTIPESITALPFLSSLNLSYNNLSGRIPSGDQIQTLVDPTIYAGNPFLCGPPISKNCSGYEPTYTPDEKKH